MIRKLMFRLLPAQIILAAVGSVNGIVSGFFATNYVGSDAMTAVGLYGPLSMLFYSISILLMGGSTILCGKYLGKNEPKKLNGVYSLNIVVSVLIGLLFTVLVLLTGIFDLSGFLTEDPAVRPLLNRYLIGQALGIVPLILGSQFASFLLMENKGRLTFAASIVYIFINILLNFLFVRVMGMQTLGLALATTIGLWVFLGLQVRYFVASDTVLRFSMKELDWSECRSIINIGLPGALIHIYQTIRGLAVNGLLNVYVGSAGISAFTATNNLLALVWALPLGMEAVSRVLISVSIGEEDRRTLTDIMRIAFRWFVPIVLIVGIVVALLAYPLTMLFYHDPSSQVFTMTVWGFRILPFCMPLSVIVMHFMCYCQASDKHRLEHSVSLLDGVVSVVLITALTIPALGMNSVYIANVLNSIVSTLFIFGWSCVWNKKIPQNMDQLMMIPDDFGAHKEDRIDINIKTIDDAIRLSSRIQEFCLSKGVDERRAYLSRLALEEMAVNIIEHGFTKDNRKNHSVDIRVVCKGDDLILRIKDDCVPFNPEKRLQLADNSDKTANIGLRMVFAIAEEIKYQNIFGMNVLQIRI